MRTTWKATLVTLAAIGGTACSDSSSITEPGTSAELSPTRSDDAAGAVYVSTNARSGNEVLVFPRARNGALGTPSAFATGGRGTGGGLGNQGAVVLNRSRSRLFVVNAGSNQLSVFAVRRGGLVLLDRVSSGGVRPISVAVHRRLVYVLNAGGAGNITGFVLQDDGRLERLAGSLRRLSGRSVDPAQVAFRPTGNLLAVTEKATNVIATYVIRADGRSNGPQVHPSVGPTPFGFAFGPGGTLVVSEAFGGAADASALSSYRTRPDGSLRVLSPSVGTNETAACWVVITRDGRFAYTSNTGSNTISGYALSSGGELTLLDANGITATTGAAPIDLALTADDRFLYSLDGAAGRISALRVMADGSLSPRRGASGLPTGANGLAAR
jgi:6-phosphogluconolactonase (cycloisomerase 2 family)